MKKIFRILFLAIAYILPTTSIAEDTYDPETGIVHMPVVSVGTENFEVDMLHQGDLVFKVISVINSTTSTSTADTYDASSGILHIPNVIVGSDNLEVEMAHQGDLIFNVTSAIPASQSTADLKFTTDYLNGKTFFIPIISTNITNEETCILEVSYTSTTVSHKEWVYQSDGDWASGCQEDFGSFEPVEYSIVNGIIQSADGIDIWTDELIEKSSERLTVKDPDGTSIWYFSRAGAEQAVQVAEDNQNSLPSLSSLIVGKTLYYIDTYNSGVNSVFPIEYKNNGELIIEFQHGREVFNYTIDGNKIIESGTEHQLIEETEKYIRLLDTDGSAFNLYFSRLDAEQATPST